MMKKRKGFKVGTIIECRGIGEMERLINSFARRGIDAKPTGNFNDVEVLGFDKRRKKK